MNYMCTVLLISYNHKHTIARALDSILEQESKYPYKIHAFDDGSSDGTGDIIKQYAVRYPNIIYPYLTKKNQGAQTNYWNAFSSVDTPYCVLLEGDDFYCNPKKIELQINALENHSECSFCGHDTYLFSEGESFREYPEGSKEMTAGILRTKTVFTYKDFVPITNGGYIPYGSARMIRSSAMKLDQVRYKEAFLFDFSQFYYLILQGDYYYIDMPMSVYVRTGEGICSGKSPVAFLNDFMQGAIDFNRQTDNVIADKIYSDCMLQIGFRLQLYANSEKPVIRSAEYYQKKLLLPDEIKDNKDSQLLIFQSKLSEDKYYYLCNGGLGHTMLLSALKPELEKRIKGKIVLMVREEQQFIPKLYNICDSLCVDLQDVNLETLGGRCPIPEKGRIYVTHPFAHPESANYYRPIHLQYSTDRYYPWLLRYYGLDMDCTYRLPLQNVSLPKELRKKVAFFGDIKKIVLFFPESLTLQRISNRIWKKKADELQQEGLIVLSCVQDKANTISGTHYIELTAEEAFRLGMHCHSIYCMRSGIADLLVSRGKDLHVFYPSHNSFFIYSLNSIFNRSDICEEIILESSEPQYAGAAPGPWKAYAFGLIPIPYWCYQFYLKHKKKLAIFKRFVKWR